MTNLRFNLLDQVACEAAWSVRGACEALFEATLQTPMHKEFWGVRSEVLEQRLQVWPKVLSCVLREGNPQMRPFDLWSYPLPLAQYIRGLGCKILGLAGAPGSGKSTLTSSLAICLGALDEQSRVLAVSLDDFYYSKAERASRGLEFRAQPGSHNLEAAVKLLSAVRDGERFLYVPRFDTEADEYMTPQRFDGPASTLLLEGWYVGICEHGYEPLREYLDYLIYIDCPTHLARKRRFGREERIWACSGGTRGFSPESMLRFWDTILEPGIKTWVAPLRETANLVMQLDLNGQVAKILRN